LESKALHSVTALTLITQRVPTPSLFQQGLLAFQLFALAEAVEPEMVQTVVVLGEYRMFKQQV
jgi:hypothetical protein